MNWSSYEKQQKQQQIITHTHTCIHEKRTKLPYAHCNQWRPFQAIFSMIRLRREKNPFKLSWLKISRPLHKRNWIRVVENLELSMFHKMIMSSLNRYVNKLNTIVSNPHSTRRSWLYVLRRNIGTMAHTHWLLCNELYLPMLLLLQLAAYCGMHSIMVQMIHKISMSKCTCQWRHEEKKWAQKYC